MGIEEGYFLAFVFLGGRARLLQCLHQAYLEVLGDPLKNGGPTDCCTEKFSTGFWTSYESKDVI